MLLYRCATRHCRRLYHLLKDWINFLLLRWGHIRWELLDGILFFQFKGVLFWQLRQIHEISKVSQWLILILPKVVSGESFSRWARSHSFGTAKTSVVFFVLVGGIKHRQHWKVVHLHGLLLRILIFRQTLRRILLKLKWGQILELWSWEIAEPDTFLFRLVQLWPSPHKQVLQAATALQTAVDSCD